MSYTGQEEPKSVNSYSMGGKMIEVWFSVPAFQDPPWLSPESTGDVPHRHCTRYISLNSYSDWYNSIFVLFVN